MSSDVRNIAKSCEIIVKIETVSWAICKSVRVRLFYLHNSADTPPSVGYSAYRLVLDCSICTSIHIFTLYFNSQLYYSAYFYITLTVHYSSNVLAVVTANLPSFSARALLPRYVTSGWTFFLPSTRKQAISVGRGQTDRISLSHDVTLTHDLQSQSWEPLFTCKRSRSEVSRLKRQNGNNRTDRRTDRRMEAMALPHPLMRSVTRKDHSECCIISIM